jgi:hypothetical protein
MAVGPQLISIQPNEGALINEGQVLHVSPTEIIFRFDDSSSIDPNSIGTGKGILLSRSGGDGIFDRAYVSTDLGTNGAVVLDFAAAVPGQTGNGLQVTFTKTARLGTSAAILTVTSTGVNIDVNTTVGLKTTAQDILNAFSAGPTASAKIIATRLRGTASTIIADTAPTTPLTLTGANTARVSSNLNAGNNVQVEFLAAQAGPSGLTSRVVVTQRDFGGFNSPIVTVTNDTVNGQTFRTVNVQMNSNARFMTTLGEFVNAINSNTAAQAVLQTRIISGNASTAIGAAVINYSPLYLTGSGDIYVAPAFIGVGETGREVVMRFAEPLPDDSYRIDILGRGNIALRNSLGQAYNSGADTSLGFRLDLGARVESIVPQPIIRNSNGTLNQLANTIHVYFNRDELNLADAENEAFYQLRYTGLNVSSQDDLIVYPRSAVYNAAAGRVDLTFSRDLNQYFADAGGQGAFRLRIGSKEGSEFFPTSGTPSSGAGIDTMRPLNFNAPLALPSPTTDPGSRFDTAADLRSSWTPSSTTPSAVVIASEIKNTTPYRLDFPGDDSEPGNRKIRYQDHVTTVDQDGIEVIEFNFQGLLGVANGSNQLNAITEDQKVLVRRILSLYENYLGVRFVETTSRGITVGVGDMRAVNPTTVNGPGFPFLATGTLLSTGQAATIIDVQDFNTADQNRFGSDLFRTFMRGIGNLLGLGFADEVPGLTVQSNNQPVNPGIDTELVFPGNADIVYGQFVHRPEGKDIDLYRIALPTSGKLKIEIAAERLADSSLLDAALRLYQLDGTTWKEISANDDYFSQDSLIAIDLPAGQYIVGVSAKGNQAYDPNIEDSGLGGRSEGKYELRFDFRPPEPSLMRDKTGTIIDGDLDGRPGGVFDHWFLPSSSSSSNTIFVDKGNSSTAPITETGNGSLASPYRLLKSAIAAAAATPNLNRIIRVLGNGGADGLLQTTGDNLVYEIGFNRLGQAQVDGTTFDVPKNTTVMIDAGAIIKVTRARIGIGSTTISVDRSGGALQVMGVPRLIDSSGRVISDSSGSPVSGSVYFTSINDRIGIGANRDIAPPAASAGDWGGIDIRNRIDASLNTPNRRDRELQGLFLNSVVHSDIRFGGGQVIVDGVSQVITPIHIVDSRPAILNNLITRSADAALAATPNSFKESNFVDPASQAAGRFIADFDRVGPSIRGNRLTSNSINGLFVKTRTGAASTTEVMTVAGRFDDLDVVHVITENLVIQGSPGGVVATLVSPQSNTIGLRAENLAGLTNGIQAGTYRYRFAFIETSGIRGPASAPTQSVNVANTNTGIFNGQVRITSLPARSPGQRLAIYRANVIGGVDSDYRLLGEVDSSASFFIDQVSAAGAALPTTPNGNLSLPSLTPTYTPSSVFALTTGLSAGAYQYVYRTVGPDGSESASSAASPIINVTTSTGVANGRVDIANLPVTAIGNRLRIYRSPIVGGVATGYILAGEVGSGTRTFVDINSQVTIAPPSVPAQPVGTPAQPDQVNAPVMVSPAAIQTSFTPGNGTGSLLNAGQYYYRFAFALSDGGESTTSQVIIGGNPAVVTLQAIHNQVLIDNLPAIPSGQTLRIYRAAVTAGQPQFELVGVLSTGATNYLDTGARLVLAPTSAADSGVPVPLVGPAFTASQNTLTNSLAAGQYVYRFSIVESTGESSAIPLTDFSSTTATVTTTTGVANGQVLIDNLPNLAANQRLRIYRSNVVSGLAQDFFQVGEVGSGTTSFLDISATHGLVLDDAQIGTLTARLDGSLVIDPGAILKLQSARIEVQDGGQLLAEGSSGRQVVMTSIDDYTYGAGGSFNTPNRPLDASGVPNRAPARGNWGGVYVGQGSTGSLDYARVIYGGGTTRIDGGFASFNAIEAHQADFRIANSTIQNNDDGVEGTSTVDRVGRGTNFAGALFVRGSQPIIIDNRIINNLGAAINIDVNSLNAEYLDDYGRSTGFIGRIGSRPDNQGPLIEGNRIGNTTNPDSATTSINGMLIRGQTLTTESVWDDTDIVHVVSDEIVSENLYTYGGLRLESKPTSSLVVKFGGGSATSTGLTASGRNLDIADRIGGSVQIIGQPSFPVILTALTDDSVGAGFQPNGLPNFDTNNDGDTGTTISLLPTGPEVDRGILIDNDVAVNINGHFEYQPQAGGGTNLAGSGITAQGRTQQLVNANVIFSYANYVDVGSDGGAISLANTTITLRPTLVSPDLVASEGNFVGNGGGIVNWRVESHFDNGVATLFNTLTFTSATALGNIRFINYLDEDIDIPDDDLLFTRGTPGQADFRVFTVDGAERIGFSQGGIYQPGAGLVNATYVGWAADVFPLLDTAILGAGTTYSVAGNINAVNLPSIVDPVVGSAFGPRNVTTAFAWDLDPAQTSSTITTFLELQATEVRDGSVPGEWRGLQFDTESNDRNVPVVLEREPARSTAQAANDIPDRSQFLGTLSSSSNSGDENARLGFHIQGAINRPSDIDVYSFYAVGGTEVWLDIDKSNAGLDSVVELIASDGTILALSDNSFDEEVDSTLLYRSSLLANNSVNSLRKSSREIFPTYSGTRSDVAKDLYSTNPKDAGLRVVLPGPANQSTLYHVRVRSSNSVGQDNTTRLANLTNPSLVGQGKSRGSYDLQIRLNEADEFPGSVVSFADVRYATTGIDLVGVPRHSPLLGETGEIPENTSTGTAVDTNGTFATAQELGNLLDTDRSTLSLAGTLSSSTDVDWYTFTIDYQLLNTQLAQYFATVFDIDYADGVGRADMSMYLYNSAGTLLQLGLSSNILDDRAGILRGADNSDLGRGSAGVLDPYIGSTELQAGRYYLAVTSQAMIPRSLLAYNNTAGVDPLLRSQPSNATQWIVEDHVDGVGSSSALGPIVPNFLPNGTASVPYTLGDVALFLNRDDGAGSTLFIANPKTGTITNTVGSNFEDFQDIAMRYNGDLQGFNSLQTRTGGADADNEIQYYNINTGTAAVSSMGNSGIQTQNLQFNATTGFLDLVNTDVGVEFNALTIANFGREVGIAVGNRGPGSLTGVQSSRVPITSAGTNVIYQFNTSNGQAVQGGDFFNTATPGNDIILGNGTDIQERGYIETNPAPTDLSTTLVFPEATQVTGLATNFVVNDGNVFTIRTPSVNATFEFNSGPQFRISLNPDFGPYFVDGDQFIMDGVVYEIQTNATPVAAGAVAVNYQNSFTNADFVNELRLRVPSTVLVGFDGNRINFSGATTINPIAGTSFGRVAVLSGNGTVGPGNVGISFLAEDTGAQLATRAATAINNLGLAGLAAAAVGNRVTVTGGNIITVTGGVRREGIAPGGTITGVAAFPTGNAFAGQVYAVSSTGGLFRVNNDFIAAETSGQVGDYIESSVELTGLRLSGLTVGPQNVEGGRYANLLFATTLDGQILAFDTTGALQPVFAGGASIVSTGQTNLTGLAFSNLDYNLWHVSANRDTDVGHGRIATPDGVVSATQGGNSWYFGLESAASNGIATIGPQNPRFGGAGLVDTYNFPGGATGVLESEPISLVDASAADAPTFYFTYHSTVDTTGNDDRLRVRVMGDDGVWRPIAVNFAAVGEPNVNIYNNTAASNSWRQARVDLSPYAGNHELRFRFEFSTGDGLGATRGPELRAIPGTELRDGQTFALSNRTFELNFGPTVIVPSGRLLTNTTTLQIGATTFTFWDGTGAQPSTFVIPYTSSNSSSQIASSIATVVNQALVPATSGGVVTAIADSGKVQITGGVAVVSSSTRMPVQGANGVGAGRIAIDLQIDMTADEVATAIQVALNTTLAGGANAYIARGELVSLPGMTVTNPGPFTFTSQSANNADRGLANDFEGIYLDDFIIGFRERGEVVSDPNTGAAIDTTFASAPIRGTGSTQIGEAIANSINVGPYQLEIRGGEEYLTQTVNGLAYSQSVGINERLSTGATLTLSGSDNLVDDDYIDIGDGVRTLRFVFKNTVLNTPLNSGEIAVPFSTSVLDSATGVARPETAATIAARLRDLINSPGVQAQLSVTASAINGAVAGLAGSTIGLSSNALVSTSDPSPRAPFAATVVNKKRGDVNTRREQGQIIIENSRITDSAEFGIRLRADNRSTISNNPNPGSVRNTIVLNNERLAPGAVIINNELIGNQLGGIQIVGDTGAATSASASVPFARIVNNTIVGGSLSQATDIESAVFNDLLFTQGTVAFADRVPANGYSPNFAGGPIPTTGFDQPTDAIGSPSFTGTAGIEPGAGQGAVSLGNGGRLIVEFVDNVLTGSGNSRPDLVVFEVGVSERVAVEVSSDATSYTFVGYIDGINSTIDLDAFGFTTQSRLKFVRLTDIVNEGDATTASIGADIDAVGALSSILATQYQAAGIGIDVGANASPTLLNNIIVNHATGLSVAASSASTVVGGMIFHRNTSNLAGSAVSGLNALTPSDSVDLFVDPYLRRLYPQAQAPSIDSVIDSLIDRAGLLSVKAPLGLQASPILAPTYDLNGLLRVDDPSIDSPFGLGENVFKDRGAQDRSDFIGPTAVVLVPIDNDTVPADVNPITGVIELRGTDQRYFDIRLFDGGDLDLSAEGTGIDPTTVNGASIILTRDDQTLVEGIDYRFGFNSTSTVIRLTPIGGVWPSDSVYTIRFIGPGQSVIPLNSVDNLTDRATYSIVDTSGNVSTFELDLGSILTLVTNTQGQPILNDGGQFVLTQNGFSQLFEFDNSAQTSTGAIPIVYTSNDSASTIVGRMITAIQGAGFTLSANALTGNRVQIIGAGVVLSGLTANLQLAGANGVVTGSIAIPLDASVVSTSALVAEAVATAIQNAGISGVTVSNVGSNVLIEGANGVAGQGATVVETIRDRAGNPLRANQVDGSTVLTIQIGAGYDYGDAPDPSYSSKKTSNGPRHLIVDGFHLGASVSADSDSPTNNSDSDDGVTVNRLVQGFSSQITVTAAGITAGRPGYLSAWIDYDRDGVFEDAERITNTGNDTLVNGSNTLNFTVPGSARGGTTYARFRYSSTRSLSPVGEAADGEVEDHQFTIIANPYSNQSNNFDVNADGSVSPIDVLQIINFLGRSGSSSVQLTYPANRPVPPYLDVNGDSLVSPIDILQVINYINRRSANGEGESASGASTWIPATAVASSASSAMAPAIVSPNVPTTGSAGSTVTPTSSTTPARRDSSWADAGTVSDDSLTTWLDDDELNAVAETAGAAANSGSPHDEIFAELDDWN